MSGLGEIIALTIIVAFLPVGLHLGALNGADIRPSKKSQKTSFERLIFRQLPSLFVINGFLIGSVVFFWNSGMITASVTLGLLALPTVVAQLTALVIAKVRDVAEGR